MKIKMYLWVMANLNYRKQEANKQNPQQKKNQNKKTPPKMHKPWNT